MSCSGLHCGGCAGGMVVPVVPLLALYGAAWVAEHIIEVAAVSATCGVLAVVAVVFLVRWGNRRDERQAVAWRQIRACGPTLEQPRIAQRTRPELAAPAVHLHFHGLPDAEQAQIIRQALPAQPEGTGDELQRLPPGAADDRDHGHDDDTRNEHARGDVTSGQKDDRQADRDQGEGDYPLAEDLPGEGPARPGGPGRTHDWPADGLAGILAPGSRTYQATNWRSTFDRSDSGSARCTAWSNRSQRSASTRKFCSGVLGWLATAGPFEARTGYRQARDTQASRQVLPGGRRVRQAEDRGGGVAVEVLIAEAAESGGG